MPWRAGPDPSRSTTWSAGSLANGRDDGAYGAGRLQDYLVAERVTSRVLTEGVTVSGSQRLPARLRAMRGRRMGPWTEGWGDNGASPPGWSARLGEPAVDDAQRDTLAVRSRVLVERRRRGLLQRTLYTGLRSGATGETPA